MTNNKINYELVNKYFNEGILYTQTQQYDKAEQSYKKAIEITPNIKEVYNNLGNVYKEIEQYDKAITAYIKATEIDKNFNYAYNNLGITYKKIQQYDKAIEAYKKAIKIDPNRKDTSYNLGILYTEIKQYDKAEQVYKKAIKIDPNYTDAIYNLGNVYQNTKQYDKAEPLCKKVIKIDPNYKEAYNNLGSLYTKTKQYDKAEPLCKKAIKIDPNYTDAIYNLGTIYYLAKKQYDDATKLYEKVLRIDPDYKEAYLPLSYINLVKKNFKEGFKLYESRSINNKSKFFNYLKLNIPVWNGENTEGNVLIIYEQGFGDSFQFFRFIIPLKRKYPNIKFTFLCNKKINHLFKDIVPIVNGINDISIYNNKVLLMSIPHILNIEEINPFVGESYINVESSKILLWKNKLSTLKKLKVAICWKGNQCTAIEKYIPLELFKNISSLDIDLISLQKGDGEQELDEISFKDKIHCFEIDIDKPFIDTVAILKNVDLFITVDTSMIHLAAMLGVKTFLVLGGVSEWRWGKSGNKSYWYESVEIFRSNTINDWTGVLKEVKDGIKKIIS